MPTLKITTKMKKSAATVTVANSNSTDRPVFGTTTVSAQAAIRIMSGPVPTQNEIDDAYPTWDRFTGSPSEILLEMLVVNTSYFKVDVNTGVIRWGMISIEAIATGTATWWIWSGNTNYDPRDRGAAPDVPGSPQDEKRLPIIMGTISEIGGSPIGDMQLVDVNIVAGQLYDIGPLNIDIPRVYTW